MPNGGIMNKKYQIFLSSTYEDLKSERQQSIKAILEMGHIPVGMEMFSASDESQWQLIKRQIDDCDYYVVIVAHRYGSLEKDISYTEKEYNYAVEIGVPVIGFIISDKARWPKSKMDLDPNIIAKLDSFKQKIKGKIIDYWSNTQDLKSKVSISLIKQMNLITRTGWVKASNLSEAEILNEISRLSKENSELRLQIQSEIQSDLQKEEDKKYKTIELLTINKIKIGFFYTGGVTWENHKKFSYYYIFNLVAPELQFGKTTEQLCYFIGTLINPDSQRKLRSSYPTPANHIKKIMTDFLIMNLVVTINPSKNDGSEIWEITPFGKEVYGIILLC
jgi:hypothetical protein